MIVLILLLTALSTFATAEVIDGIAANADGQTITISDLRQKLTELKVDKKKGKEVLDKMIDEALIEGEIRRRGLNATPAEIDEAIQQVVRQNGLTTYAELMNVIKGHGMNELDFRSGLKRQVEQGKFANLVMGARIKITEPEIKRHYDQYYLGNNGEPLYKLSVIFLKSPAPKGAMEAIQKELKQGATFANLAKSRSQGPGAKEGGQLGEFRRNELDADFFAAIADLKAGQISKPVSRSDGLYLFKLDSVSKGSAPSLRSVTNEIRQKLQNKEMDRLLRLWLQSAREKAYIDIRLKDFGQI